MAQETDKIDKTPKCPKCRDLKYEIKNGKRVPCSCFVGMRAQVYLRPLGDIEKPSAGMITKVKTVVPHSNIFINFKGGKQSEQNGVLAHLLLRSGRSFEVLNAYELIEIFLGHMAERYQSVLEIRAPLLIILFGYAEMENRRQEDLILQVLDNRIRLGLHTWFVCKGPMTLSQVEKSLKDKGFTWLSLAS